MKRKKQKTKHPKGKNANALGKGQGRKAETTRRDFMRKVGNGSLALAVVGGGGWLIAEEVEATMRESDLSRLGNGIPTVVQIHDPQCSRCIALQREARDALCEIDESQLQFLVANIRTSKGRRLAQAHGVGHVTLLLFDSKGQRKDILAGPNESEFLARVFRQHLKKYGTSPVG